MEFIFNNPKYKDRRKDLRKNQTDAEVKVWGVLRNKQCLGLKFFRQFSVGPYILDFYCPKKRLSIEIDGGQHAAAKHKEYDEIRTHFLEENNITELRFWNHEVLENPEGVYDKILENCK